MTGDFDPRTVSPELIEGYLRSAQAQIDLLSSLADRLTARGDDPVILQELRREAHKVRGSAGSYGYGGATEVAGRLEESARGWLAGSGLPAAGRGIMTHALVGRLRAAFGRPAHPDDLPDVFLVGHDEPLIDLLEYGLSTRGYRTRALRDGRDAFETLRALPTGDAHPVLLLDVDLPGVDGLSLFHMLQLERPGAYRVVFLTVHGGEDEALRALEGGAVDYVVKPITLGVALEKIRHWVGS